VADETTATTTEIPPPSTEPKQPDPPKQETPPGRTYTDQEVNDLIAKNKRQWQDSDDIKAGKAAQKRLAELEEAQKTETEKLTDRATKAETLAEQRAVKYRTALIRSHFTTQAGAAGIPSDRIDAAFRLSDFSAVTVDEDKDVVTGLEPVVAALPDWLKADLNKKPPAPDINAGANGANQPDPVAREADLRRRFRLNP
jgi:ABC-type transporter Mla subunit MlaD